MKKIAFVTPWYGRDIPGGAEAELRGIVKHLQAAGIDLEILTTCVKEFNSDWNTDYYPEGPADVDGIAVRRFTVRKRNTSEFDRVNYKLMNKLPVTEKEEEIFVKEMINSPGLYEYMAGSNGKYDLFVFIPYMFGTTFYGIQVCPQKAVLISCFHSEAYIHMNIFKEVFSSLKGIIYLSRPELELANSVFDLSKVKQQVLGAGVDCGWEADPDAFRKKFHIHQPFLLYAGRKDAGKNVDTLVKYFEQYKKRNDNLLKLVLIGGGRLDMEQSKNRDIINLGYISVKDKYNAYSAAEILCQPSKNESFSLVIMESWLAERPVIVHEECSVTTNFVRESSGGLYFKDYYEFEGCLNYFLSNNEIAKQMGCNGREYVVKNFSWDIVTQKYISFFEKCIG